jgi:hypothetical protein
VTASRASLISICVETEESPANHAPTAARIWYVGHRFGRPEGAAPECRSSLVVDLAILEERQIAGTHEDDEREDEVAVHAFSNMKYAEVGPSLARAFVR